MPELCLRGRITACNHSLLGMNHDGRKTHVVLCVPSSFHGLRPCFICDAFARKNVPSFTVTSINFLKLTPD